MSWGLELWDQYDNVSSHTAKGIDFCEKYVHFLRDRCAIETKYAGELKGLIKKYQPKKKKEEEEDAQFSWYRGFLDMMKELHDLAGQHEVIAENSSEMLIKQLTSLVQELKQERRQSLTDGSKLTDLHQRALQQLEKSKKSYDRAYRESERALDAYRKADADINLSRADVEKTKHTSNTKSQQSEDAKNEYAAQLQKTNQHRHDYYTRHMPSVFQQLQEMDEKRINQIKHVVKESAVIHQGVIPIINTCLEGMVKASESVDASADSKLVIDKYKSGFEIPGDIAFEDLNNGPTVNSPGPNSVKQDLIDNKNKGGTMSGRSKKRTKIFGIFSSSKADEQKEDFTGLNPNQKKKKLQSKLDALKRDIAKETAEREGMLKMKEVYANNTALGDPNSLDKKIEENAQKLDALQQEYKKYEEYLLEAEGKLHRRGSDDSMTHSMTSSDPGNVINNTNSSSATVPDNNVYAPIDGDDPDLDGSEGEFEEAYPVIGTCRALYAFTALNEGSVGMVEEEEMLVLEMDQGDGWTRVRKNENSEGFVPTSYIQCHFYDQDAV